MADIYERMQATAKRLLSPTSEGGLGQGTIAIVRTIPGAPDANPWDPRAAPEREITILDGVARGVGKELIGAPVDNGGQIVATDLTVIVAPWGGEYEPADALEIDDAPVTILKVENIPAAGTVCAIKFVVRGGAKPRATTNPPQPIVRKLSGGVTGSASLYAAFSLGIPLSGSVIGMSGVAGTASSGALLAGSIIAGSAATGVITGLGGMAGAVTGTSSLAGAVSLGFSLSGATAGGGEVAGALSVSARLLGSAAGTSALSATLSARAPLSGSVTGAGDTAGTITVSAAPAIPAYWYNYSASRLAPAKSAKTAQANGTAPLLLVVLGDSTSVGPAYGVQSPEFDSAQRIAGSYDKNPLSKLAGLLTDGNAQAQWADGNVTVYTAAGFTKQQALKAYNPRADVGAGWSINSQFFNAASDGTPYVIRPSAAIDTVEWTYLAASGSAFNFTRADGAVPTVTVLNNGNSSLRAIAKFPSASTSPVSVSQPAGGGQAYMNGWRAWNSAIKSADVVTMAACGARAIDYNTTGTFGYLTQTFETQPNIVFVNLLLNDILQGASTTDYAAAMDGILSKTRAALPNATIVAVVPPPTNAVSQAVFESYRDALKPVVVARDVMMLDLYALFTYASLTEPGLYYDGTHGLEPYSTRVAAAYKEVLDAI